eukprot:GEMP01003099.1.p1 GENE.GEMP01003099.1~~GEMP01003099.1.p1  ORF type:complete len:707 (+),score=169.77 GEMP01003099.1:43-2121(+)
MLSRLVKPTGASFVRGARRWDYCVLRSTNDTRSAAHMPFFYRGFATSSSSQRRLERAERDYENDPHSEIRLYHLVKALNESNQRDEVIRKIEDRCFTDGAQVASTDRIIKEYVLAKGNGLEMEELKYILGAGPQSQESGASRAGQHLSAVLNLNDEPVKVRMVETNKSAAWKAFRWALVVLVSAAGVSVILETLVSVNVQKGLGMGGAKKNVPVEDTGVSLADVKGCDEVKDEILEVISYLQDSARFIKIGAKLPKGLLLCGPPGTGKTLLARAIAGEAGVPFFQASGSDFEEMFVGVGARRIRDLFAAARKHAPCIVFIDEIDAVAQKRSARDNTAVRMTLNQLLVELDGFTSHDNIVVLCATNLPKALDKALTRPGRLDKTIVVPLPDLKGRLEILDLYAAKLQLSDDVDMSVLARRTAGMTGADLANVLNIAAVRASSKGLDVVGNHEIEEAYDRVVVGLERRNPMSEEEKKMTAFHEGGHTLVSMFSPDADTVHKATIMPRGQALGITWSIPDKEKFSQKLCEFRSRLRVLMGGKVAEELIYGRENVSAGCSSDLQQATGLARRMVMQFGMSNDDKDTSPGLSLMSVDADEYAVLSEESKRVIDRRTEHLLHQAYEDAWAIIRDHEKGLRSLADALVEHETLNFEEINLAVEGKHDAIRDLRSVKKAEAKKSELERKRIKNDDADMVN